MTNGVPRRTLLSTVSVALPLIGCSILPNPLRPQIYRLNPTLNPFPPGPVIHGRLAIAAPTAPLSLDTARIALTLGLTRFDYYADSVWTDRPPALLQTLLLETFEGSGRMADVQAETADLTRGAVLYTDVRQFEAHYADPESHQAEIAVALDLRLKATPEGKQIGRTLIEQRVPAAQNRMDTIVDAFDAATAAALWHTVEWTLVLLAHSARERVRPARSEGVSRALQK